MVPVVDNTASPTNTLYPSWQENAETPSLSPAKMVWYKMNYSPNEADWTKWDNSPIYAPDEAFQRAPPTWICVAELDILRDEGLAYAEKLKSFGIPVEVKLYKGAPHPIMAMDGERILRVCCQAWLTIFHFQGACKIYAALGLMLIDWISSF